MASATEEIRPDETESENEEENRIVMTASGAGADDDTPKKKPKQVRRVTDARLEQLRKAREKRIELSEKKRAEKEKTKLEEEIDKRVKMALSQRENQQKTTVSDGGGATREPIRSNNVSYTREDEYDDEEEYVPQYPPPRPRQIRANALNIPQQSNFMRNSRPSLLDSDPRLAEIISRQRGRFF
jgi:hypothetical protein